MPTKAIVEKLRKRWLNITEASRYLGCSKNYVYDLINEDKVSASRMGKKTWVEVDSIDKLIERHKI